MLSAAVAWLQLPRELGVRADALQCTTCTARSGTLLSSTTCCEHRISRPCNAEPEICSVWQVEVPDAEDHVLVVEWTNGPHKAKLVADFQAADFHTEVTRPDESQPHRMTMLQYRCNSWLQSSARSSVRPF